MFRWRADDDPLLVIFGSSLSLKKEEKFGSRSDRNGIQERMFRKFKHLAMHLKACKASILSNIRLCRAKADAHEKHLQVSFSAPIYDIF